MNTDEQVAWGGEERTCSLVATGRAGNEDDAAHFSAVVHEVQSTRAACSGCVCAAFTINTPGLPPAGQARHVTRLCEQRPSEHAQLT